MKKKLIGLIVFISLLITVLLFEYNHNYFFSKKINEIDPPDITREVNIMATGDIIYHMVTYINNFDEESGKYDFSSFYNKMKPYIDSSDIMIGNYETTSNPNRLYSGFPTFNTPPESIEYLKNIGFDVLSTANNHCIDTGVEGIISTIDIMDQNNIKHFGTYKENIDRGIIIEKNNIKIGFLGYSERFNGMDSLVSKEEKFMISPFNIEEIKKDIDILKNKGANFIIIYPHWGNEYVFEPSDFQKLMKDELLEAGADVILGSHSHVLQPTVYDEINNEKKFTIYSMGNSISNQRREWMKRDGTETGVFVNIKITKKDSEDKAVLENIDLIPTYVNRFKDDRGKFIYEVVALKDYIEGGIYRDTIDESTKKRVDDNYNNAIKILYPLGE